MTATASRWATWLACVAALFLVGMLTATLIDPLHHLILIGGGIWLGTRFPGLRR